MNWKKILLNKYFLIGIFFLIWMLFFDQNSIRQHVRINNEIKDLHTEHTYYKNKVTQEGKRLYKLQKDPAEVEKIAREKYYMKKKNEEVFIIKTDKKP